MQSLAAAALVCAAVGVAQAAEIVIAERGRKAEYSIVIPADPSPSERYAAEELQDHLKKLVGVDLAIVSGESPSKAIVIRRVKLDMHNADDAFRLRSDASGNVSVEGGRRGVLYGVYELLETYGGIGWFASWHTHIPKKDVFSLPADLDVRQTSAIDQRNPYWCDVKGDFAARVRANSGFQALGAKHGGRSFGFGGGLGICHTFDKLLSVKEHFDAHPEYFSYRKKKGKRVGKPTQLCLTNPDVLRIVTSNVLERIRDDPNQLCYGVSQNDNREYCECEKCSAVDAEEESTAGTMVRFVNAVAEAVEREFPGKIIETLAYEYTRKPPKKTRLRHNVMPCLCTSGVDFSVPIRESRHAETKRFLDDINGWGAQTKHLYIWDYTVNFRHYPHVFPNIRALQGNLKLFRDNSTIGILAQGDYTGFHASYGELKAWLLAKWMWNPDLPMEPLLDRFFTGYYGKAAPLARKAFDIVFDECVAASTNTNTPPLVMYADIEREPPSEATMARAAELWRAAEAVAEDDDPSVRYNVRMSALGVYYTVAMRFAYVGYRKGWPLLYLTRDAAARERLLCVREAARRTRERMSEARAKGRKVVLVEHWDDEWNGVLRRIANAPDPQADVLRLNASQLRIQMTNECSLVESAESESGKALKFLNSGWNWAATFNLSGIKFDKDASYRIRIRARADLTGKEKGNAVLSSGVYDRETKKDCAVMSRNAAQIRDGWAWYDVGVLEPKSSQYLWIAAGRFDRGRFAHNPSHMAVWVDQVEISRAGK